MNNLTRRIISGCILFVVLAMAMFCSEVFFMSLIFALAVMMFGEWYDMAQNHGKLVHGLVLLIPSLVSILLLRDMDGGEYLLLLALVLISSVDSFAMFGGQKFGGKKLAPIISPRKTYSGLVVGSLSALVAVNITAYILQEYNMIELPSYWVLSVVILMLAVLEQMSDLLLSFYKRQFSVKDSGDTIPGHGGVLDRFDGMVLVLPVIWLLAQLY